MSEQSFRGLLEEWEDAINMHYADALEPLVDTLDAIAERIPHCSDVAVRTGETEMIGGFVYEKTRCGEDCVRCALDKLRGEK